MVSVLNNSHIEAEWHLIYSKPRAEKKLYNDLIKRGFEAYLPLQRTLKQWSDRKKWTEIPLFPSYIFVLTEPKLLNEIGKCLGFVKFVAFENKPVTVDHKVITLIQNILDNYSDVQAVEEKLPPGTCIEILHGPLAGTFGELINYQGKKTAVIKINNVDYSLLVQIPEMFLRELTT